MQLDRTIFRLACCCGLRVSEIAQLRLDDVQLDSLRPHFRIRSEVAKGGRARRVRMMIFVDLEDLRARLLDRVLVDLSVLHDQREVISRLGYSPAAGFNGLESFTYSAGKQQPESEANYLCSPDLPSKVVANCHAGLTCS